jgi:hypothetical protein
VSRSFLLPTALSALLFVGCDSICMEGVPLAGTGRVRRDSTGACVAVLVTPDLVEDDGGADAGPEPDAGEPGQACEPDSWTTRVLDEGVDSLTAAFVFDARGVGHYAYSKGARLHVGTTRLGDAPVRVDSVSTAYDVHLAVATDGTHHVLFQQGDSVGYAHDTGGTWRASLIGKGWAGTLALDARDTPHVLIGEAAPQGGYLHGLLTPDGDWNLTPLDSGGRRGALERMVVDAFDHVHLAFAREETGGAKVIYASNTSGTWVEEPLDWELPLGSPRVRFALQVEPTGRPVLVGASAQGAHLWVKQDGVWKKRGLGSRLSRGPALSFQPTGGLGHVLLDDSDENAPRHDRPSDLVVKSLLDLSDTGTTPPLAVESSDGGIAFVGQSAVASDASHRLHVGFSYVRYPVLPDGGWAPMVRGLRYATACP